MTRGTAPAPSPPAVPPGLRTALSAIENASAVPVDATMVFDMLRTGRGHPSHLRPLFGDVDLTTLDRVAAAGGIAPRTLLASYRRARRSAAASNAELEALLQADGAWDKVWAGDDTALTGAEPT